MFITLIFVISGVLMFLWNAILPDLIGVNSISYWQSMGLLILSRILFGRFSKPERRTSFPYQKFKEKFQNMSFEEREKFREKWKS
ncbi:MAG TPA: hypothetical protein ENK91_04125 [Bacteroidetes bacterium]|nr:hypothetical protein [Bacteroidota bacterium]